ncbi:MAG: phospholipase [Muribaculaceae bacterium]|nr:phospholipase [Muribaculaceae bacterium]
MILALYILIALIAVGTLLRLLHKPGAETDGTAADAGAAQTPPQEQCCGMHITCERDSLLASVSPTIEYYDDEELDAYQGTSPDAYSPQAVEEFRNVLLTLLPDDIAGWARSLQLRGIELPSEVREELLLIVSEERMKR